MARALRRRAQADAGCNELITNKNYSEAERLLHAVDMLMLDLIEEQSRARVFSQSGRRGLTFRKATVAPASRLLSFRPRLPTRALPFGAPLDPPFKKLK
jgi:hypothetical protein